MKRRSFVKKSISASILTPLAFSGLINAAGAVEGGTETGTTWETGTTDIQTSSIGADLACLFASFLVETKTFRYADPSGVSYCYTEKVCWQTPTAYLICDFVRGSDCGINPICYLRDWKKPGDPLP